MKRVLFIYIAALLPIVVGGCDRYNESEEDYTEVVTMDSSAVIDEEIYVDSLENEIVIDKKDDAKDAIKAALESAENNK